MPTLAPSFPNPHCSPSPPSHWREGKASPSRSADRGPAPHSVNPPLVSSHRGPRPAHLQSRAAGALPSRPCPSSRISLSTLCINSLDGIVRLQQRPTDVREAAANVSGPPYYAPFSAPLNSNQWHTQNTTQSGSTVLPQLEFSGGLSVRLPPAHAQQPLPTHNAVTLPDVPVQPSPRLR